MTKHTRNAPRMIVAMLATVTALCLAGPVAFAQAGDATSDQYSNPVHKVAADIGGGGNGPSAQSGLHKKVVGGLPFTGLDVVALAAVAIALMSMGIALRRLTAERHAS